MEFLIGLVFGAVIGAAALLCTALYLENDE